MTSKFKSLFSTPYPIIGALHFMPLLGYRGFNSMEDVRKAAFYDLEEMIVGGVNGIIIENNYDLPHRTQVGPETIASMSILADKIKQSTQLPLGVSVLWNDYAAGFAIAKAVGCQFIRISAFVDDVQNKYGIANAVAEEALKFQRQIKADEIAIFADVQVKHAQMIDQNKSLEQSVREAEDMQADGVILTGDWTGVPPSKDHLKLAKQNTSLPVIIGSGVNAENIAELATLSDAAIVGTYFKQGQDKSAAEEHNIKSYLQRVDHHKVERLMHNISSQG